jgi:hypothetical protein
LGLTCICAADFEFLQDILNGVEDEFVVFVEQGHAFALRESVLALLFWNLQEGNQNTKYNFPSPSLSSFSVLLSQLLLPPPEPSPPALFILLSPLLLLSSSSLPLPPYPFFPDSALLLIGVRHGVSKGIEDSSRLPALQAGHP